MKSRVLAIANPEKAIIKHSKYRNLSSCLWFAVRNAAEQQSLPGLYDGNPKRTKLK